MPPDTQTQAGRSSGNFQSQGALGEMAVRSAGQWFDMQLSAMRTLWETQARTAAAFGLPDYSGLLPGGSEERLRDVLASSTERLVSTARRTSDAAAQINRRIGSILESQAGTAAQSWQQGIERLSEQTDEALEQLCRTAQEQAQQLERATQNASDAVTQGMQAGGDTLRQAMKDGSQRGTEALSHMGEATREAARQQGDQNQKPGQGASNDEKQQQKRERVA